MTRFDLLDTFAWLIAIGEQQRKIYNGEFTCNLATSNKIEDLYQRKKYVYIGTRPLLLPPSLTQLSQPLDLWVSRDTQIVDNTVDKFKNWLHNTANLYLGLGQFDYVDAIDGNTQAFDLFYLRHRNKHIKICKGEWIYNVQQLEANNFNWSYVEDVPLAKGDALLISAPFSGYGAIHPNMQNLLNQCEDLQIPVLIDACFSVVTSKVVYDFSSPAIENISFGCSKIFPLQGVPAGIRYSRLPLNDFQTIKLKREYQNRLNFAVLNRFLDIPQQTIIDIIKQRQTHWCDYFKLQPCDVGYYGLASDYLLEAHSYWDTISPKAKMTDYKPTISLVSLIENHDYFVNQQKILGS